MAFNVAALSAYIEDQDFPLVAKMQATGGLSDIADIQVGLKGSSNLQYLNTNVVFAADACTRVTSDTSTFSQRTITVGAIQAGEDLCIKNLNGYWTQTMVKQGCAGENEMPAEIESVWLADKMNTIQNALDVADWQGDLLSATNNLSYYDGFLVHIDAASFVDGNPTAITVVTGITVTNVIGILQGIWLLIPENILAAEDLSIFLGNDTYRLYVNALINANLFHFIGEDGISKLHGTNVSIRPMVGLTGTDRLIATRNSNLVIGMDGASDEDELTVRLDPVTGKKMLFDVCFKRGTQIRFADEGVEFTLVP